MEKPWIKTIWVQKPYEYKNRMSTKTVSFHGRMVKWKSLIKILSHCLFYCATGFVTHGFRFCQPSLLVLSSSFLRSLAKQYFKLAVYSVFARWYLHFSTDMRAWAPGEKWDPCFLSCEGEIELKEYTKYGEEILVSCVAFFNESV